MGGNCRRGPNIGRDKTGCGVGIEAFAIAYLSPDDGATLDHGARTNSEMGWIPEHEIRKFSGGDPTNSGIDSRA